MKNVRRLHYALAGMMLLWGAAAAHAQHYHGNGHNHNGYNQGGNYYQGGNYNQGGSYYNPGYHIDHHDHNIVDSHGHVTGTYHHDVPHQNSTPRYNNQGGYYDNGLYNHGGNRHAGHQYGGYTPGGYTNTGGYTIQNGAYYYTPQSASNHGAHLTAYRPQQVPFGGFSHVDDLASRLEDLSNQFCLDLHYNYSHNPGFAETYREAYQVLETARYIHAAEHQHDRQAIRDRLDGLDKLLHHVQDDLRGWSRHHHRQVGSLGIMDKSDQMESTLHHLMNDVGVTQSNAAAVGTGDVIETAPPSILP